MQPEQGALGPVEIVSCQDRPTSICFQSYPPDGELAHSRVMWQMVHNYGLVVKGLGCMTTKVSGKGLIVRDLIRGKVLGLGSNVRLGLELGLMLGFRVRLASVFRKYNEIYLLDL